MGKTTCEACNKRCKGHAIKLSETRFVHLKCFTCKECKKQLSANSFFVHKNDRYCTEDYQRLFGTKCHSCDKYVEGQVVTVLGKTYHQDCILCSKCKKNIGAGSKVTVVDSEFWCQSCVTEAELARLSKLTSPDGHLKEPITRADNKAPHGGLLSQRPQEISVRQNQLGSPDSDFAGDMKDGGGDDDPGITSPDLLSPASATSGYKSDDVTSDQDSFAMERPGQHANLNPVNVTSDDSRDVNHNINVSSNTPHDQCSSTSSSDSQHLSKKLRNEGDRPNFGKFYQTSFLDKDTGFKRGPSINPQEKTPQHFHRPHGFSYRLVRSDIPKPSKTGMLKCLAGNTLGSRSLPRKLEHPYKPTDSEEPIQLAKIPDAQKTDHHQMPIERDDFVAPPEPAAIYPDLLRDPCLREKFLQGDVVDHQSENKENDPNAETLPVNTKIEKEINELAKITNSGTAQLILEDLKKKKKLEPHKLDPRSCSRSRSAAVEPFQKTRFESPVFASPSRDLLKARLLDDYYEQKYRTCASPVPRPVYGLKSGTLDPRMGCTSAMEFRSSTLQDPRLGKRSSSACRSATLGTRNGYASDTMDGYYPSNISSYHRRPESSTAVLERSYTPLSDAEGYDPTTGLKVTRNYLHRLNVIFDGRHTPNPRSQSLRRNLQGLFTEEEKTKIYPYEMLSLDNPERPPGLDDNNLEQYLADDEFVRLFGMSREVFMSFAEWKRNDLKQRVRLFDLAVEKSPTPCPT